MAYGAAGIPCIDSCIFTPEGKKKKEGKNERI